MSAMDAESNSRASINRNIGIDWGDFYEERGFSA
jgi:hypothetical protein